MEKGYPKIGYRGVMLAKWGLALAFYIITLGFAGMCGGLLTGTNFVNICIFGAAVGGVGPAGHQVSNIVERRQAPSVDPPPWAGGP